MKLPPDLRFLFSLARPYASWLAGATLLMALENGLLLSYPLLAARVTLSLQAGVVPATLLFAWLGLVAVQALVAYGTGLLVGAIGTRVAADLGCRVYDHLQALPLGWHQERRRGEVLALLVNDSWRMGAFLTGTLAPLAPTLFTFVGALVLLLAVNAKVGLLMAAAVPLLVLAARLLSRRLRPLADASQREDAIRWGMAQQNLSALLLIKSFTREHEESARYRAQGERVRSLEFRQLRLEAALAPTVRLLGSAALVVLLWFGGRELAAGSMSAAGLVSLLLYGVLLVQPVGQFASVYGQLQAARSSASRLVEVLGEEAESQRATAVVPRCRGEIRFESVAFAYPGRPELFECLDWHVEPGETVAVIGRNGAGKSSLANLLLRFRAPASGRILLDGVDIASLSISQLRQQIGLVSQHVLLLNASVADNIGYGRLGATPEQIRQAAIAANAHDFIGELPQGYDTVVGDEGVRLSGGQKQRIALARALLKDPPILMLDEATAMFDPDGEREFIAECHSILHARTVILITHRPASLDLADRIFRLEAGKLHALRSRERSEA